MSPGLAVDKQVLSSRDLLTHSADPSVYPSSDIIRSLIDAESFATAKVGQETVLDLLCFGSSEVKRTHTFPPFFSPKYFFLSYRFRLCSVRGWTCTRAQCPR